MNTETTSTAPAAPGRPVTQAGALLVMMRREFWEHRALWLVPTLFAGFMAAAALVSTRASISIDDADRVHADRAMVLNVSQDAFAGIIFAVAAVVVSFYVLDCLYAERKDRSILFWKSLPVSDGLTVLSKFLVAILAVPLLAFVLATVSHLIALIAWSVRARYGGFPDLIGFEPVAWVRGEAFLLVIMLLGALWYAPVVAACMLMSVWIKRAPLLWAFLGPFLLWLGEIIVFRTHYVGSVLQYRAAGIWRELFSRNGHEISINGNSHLLSDLNWGAAFTNANLWLGVVAAGLFLYAAARVRRYRDDT
ncbi:MAG: hypothetical protein JSS29_12445 [Proteobacteria bacterium]|nr:hypothetical protein [Pseudomonadota bacterium]